MSNQEILAYEDRRFAAMASGDLETLALLLSEDLHYVHANGMIEDKREFLRKLSSGERRYLAFRAVERTCRRDGDFTFVFGEAEVEVNRAAGRLSNRLTYSAIYKHGPPPIFLAWHAVKSLQA